MAEITLLRPVQLAEREQPNGPGRSGRRCSAERTRIIADYRARIVPKICPSHILHCIVSCFTINSKELMLVLLLICQLDTPDGFPARYTLSRRAPSTCTCRRSDRPSAPGVGVCPHYPAHHAHQPTPLLQSLMSRYGPGMACSSGKSSKPGTSITWIWP